jgi:hypothetical protein
MHTLECESLCGKHDMNIRNDNDSKWQTPTRLQKAALGRDQARDD